MPNNRKSSGNGRSGDGPLAQALARSGAPRSGLTAPQVELMLAESEDEPWSGPDWIFELKVDGYRAVAGRSGGGVQLVYRKGSDAAASFPELVEGLRALPGGDLVLDGELCVLDPSGRPSFQLLQRRGARVRPIDAARLARELPATYCVFDLLAAEGHDLRGLPLQERKRLLGLLLAGPGPWQGRVLLLGHVPGSEGPELYRRARALGLEGLMGKRRDSTYRAGRHRDWRKLRVLETHDFALVGLARGQGSRAGLGSVHLACWDGTGFVYCGSAGSGLTARDQELLLAELEREQVAGRPCSGPPAQSKDNLWVEPRRVVEVRYFGLTEERLLRQPVFLRLRDDKSPKECPPPRGLLPAGPPAPQFVASSTIVESSESPPPPPRPRPPAQQKFSNLTKLLWPEEKISKGDLIDYYRAVSPWLLPWLRDRPVTLTRYPDGIQGKSFFQKNAPEHTPDWVRTSLAPAERWGGEPREEGARSDHIHAIVIDELETLLYVANLAAIPLHIPAARLAAPLQPDWGVIDLDPKGAPFSDVVRCALETRAQADAIGLPCFPKTSGQAGLHLLVPLGGQLGQQEARALCELLARLVESRLPKLATLARPLDQRRGRVYLDTLQNGRGKTIAAPYSVRPIAGARASAPLLWDEVDDQLDPAAFTLRTLPERLQRLGHDPCAAALAQKPDLQRALALLEEKLR